MATYSHSRVSTFENCPYKYKLQYIDRAEPEISETIELFMGKRVGSIGNAGCFSFYPTKNLGGMCQGGAVITDSDEVADTVRSLGNVGRAKNSHTDFDFVGFNSRLDAINAAFLTRSLKNIDKDNSRRIEIANIYNANLEHVSEIRTPFVLDHAQHVYHLYTIRICDGESRDGLQNYLKSKDIGCGVYYPKPCHKQNLQLRISLRMEKRKKDESCHSLGLFFKL